jgi:hypothetical protein
MAVCLVAGSPVRIVGDGGEYLAMTLSLSRLEAPGPARRDIPALEQAVAEADPALARWSIEDATIEGRAGRRDFLHFWIYPLLNVPALWLTRFTGLTPLAAFTITNVCLWALALWIALPRIGLASCVLLFGGPLVWWLDKAHVELFTFVAVAIALLLMRDRPAWSIVAAGFAAAQNSPLAVLPLAIVIAAAIWRRDLFRDRTFLAAVLCAALLCAIQPAYTYARHGTFTLLSLANPAHAPSIRQLLVVPFDLEIGLLPNFPALALIVAAAAALVTIRAPRELVSGPQAVALVAAAGFLFAFSQAANVHHGATPSLSRYAIWLVPCAIPLLGSAYALGRRAWTAFTWTVALVSTAVSVFVFHPAVPQNGREPTLLAAAVWTRYPALTNPLPEIFAETWLQREERWLPVATSGCEKVLLEGRGERTTFPVPCFPAPVPEQCAATGELCYANLDGSAYRFVRAPGGNAQTQGFRYQNDWAWPAAGIDAVRRAFLQAGWPNLHQPSAADNAPVRLVKGAYTSELAGPNRYLVVIREARPDAQLVLRVPPGASATLVDATTGDVVRSISYSGPPNEPWPIDIGVGKLAILTLQMR